MQKYIDHCREKGVTNDSLLVDIVDEVYEFLVKDNPYALDVEESDTMYDKAHKIAVRIDGKL